MDQRRTYDFMGDNARRFMGLPLRNPDPNAAHAPALEKRLRFKRTDRATMRRPLGADESRESATAIGA